jgi:hypothetical protein
MQSVEVNVKDSSVSATKLEKKSAKGGLYKNIHVNKMEV